MNLYDFDYQIIKEGYKLIAGVDESGRGPLAGPVVASAVILNFNEEIFGLNDSKKLREDQREKVYGMLSAKALSIGIGIVSPDIIDKINIFKASILAMKLAIEDLKIKPDLVLIDGMDIPYLEIPQKKVIKGDTKSASIAAASVIAKVTRDKIMLKYHNLYPLYGFDKNKGYPTLEHISRLNTHGPCAIHRRSFRKVCSLTLKFD